MSSVFLSSAIENSEYLLPRAIQRARRDLLKLEEVHQICTLYRQLGVATMFVEGKPDRFHRCSMQSAAFYLSQLDKRPDEDKVTSFAKPWFDAVASHYWDAAKLIVDLSRSTHNPKREYEDDFLYVWFLMQHVAGEAPRSVSEALLDRYEVVLQGSYDVRLDICRALLDDDAEEFADSLSVLIDERAERVNEMIDKGSILGDAAGWLRSFALEGMALLAIAERQGMPPMRRVLHCPDLARGGSPYVFSMNVWVQVNASFVRKP